MVLDQLVDAAIAFGRNFIGTIVRPYETYRRIVDRASAWELAYIGLLLALYFTLASLVKTATFRPFLLTKQFILLVSAAAITYVCVVGTVLFAASFVRHQGSGKRFAIAWAYTLLPTVLWFLITSLLYVLLPPPRTTSAAGILFSIVFLVFSATMFFWKMTLAYLALRFSLKLDLAKILVVSAISLPIIGLYSWAMFGLGIFKVPFL